MVWEGESGALGPCLSFDWDYFGGSKDVGGLTCWAGIVITVVGKLVVVGIGSYRLEEVVVVP